MTRNEQDRMNELCKRIAVEKDPKVFDQLVKELDNLLEVKRVRINPAVEDTH
jgi:hypothetical protein